MAKPGEEDAPPSESGEGGESTVVATTAPDIGGVPLPISSPPPAGMAAKPAPAAGKPPGAPMTPVGVKPVGAPARPPGAPLTPRAPGVAGAVPPSARMPGAPARPPGVSAGKMTVVGLGPPGVPLAPNRPPGIPASQRTPGPPGVRPPSSARMPAAPPAAAETTQKSAKVSAVASPPAPATKAAAPAKPAGAVPGVPVLHGEEDEPEDDGPTMASEPGAFADMQRDYDAAGMGRSPAKPVAPAPAPAPVAAPANKSPLATTGYTPSPAESTEENEAATAAIPKDVLDRVRANPKAVLEEELKRSARAPTPAAGAPPRVFDEEVQEETKAIPRDELLRKQDAHVVVGSDAQGDDATLAVMPGQNDAAANVNIAAAIGATLGNNPDGAFPPPPGGYPGGPSPIQQTMPSMGQQPGGPPPNDPGMHPGMHQHWSSGQMSAAPRVPGGVQSYPGGPMMAPPHARNQGQAPTNWQPLQAPKPRSKISGQMILLFVVGFVCLAIFVTGIVLFATTKF